MITADSITDEMIEAIRDVACECRPYPEIESSDHASRHDCDVETYDHCVVALEATGEEALEARCKCADFANEVIANHSKHSAYRRAIDAINARAKAKP